MAAIAAGTPVVVTPGAGIRSLMETTGSRGAVVGSVGKPGELADAIRRVRSSVEDPPDPAEVFQMLKAWKIAGTEALRASVLRLASVAKEE
jgi:hypothetical protein